MTNFIKFMLTIIQLMRFIIVAALGIGTGLILVEIYHNGAQSVIERVWYGPNHPIQDPTYNNDNGE